MASRGDGWRLVQLERVLTELRKEVVAAHRVLRPVADALDVKNTIVLTADDYQVLDEHVPVVVEVSEALHPLLEALPNEIEATVLEIRRAAAHELTQGIIDPRRVVNAVSVLDARTALLALAEALHDSGTARAWGPLTIGTLFGAIDGGSWLFALSGSLEQWADMPIATYTLPMLDEVTGALKAIAHDIPPRPTR
jgi:hypothetical protein